jgi:hypothetical protein
VSDCCDGPCPSCEPDPFEVRFDDGQQTILTVAHAQQVADALLEQVLGAAENIRIVRDR